MGRFFSRGITIITKPDSSTLRPAGLGSAAGVQRYITYPAFVEPQQPVTNRRAPHPSVTCSVSLHDVGANCKAENPYLLGSSSTHIKTREGNRTDLRARGGEDSLVHTTFPQCHLLAKHTSEDENGTLHDSLHDTTRDSLREISLCLEPEAHEQPPVSPPRPSRGAGSAAFRERQIGQQDLLQHVSEPQRSSSSTEYTGRDKREGIRTRYYPHDTHNRIFATEPFTGRIRVRGEVAMKLYMRNFCSCPEEESEPFKQKKRHVRPADHFNILKSATMIQDDTGRSRTLEQDPTNSRTCPTNVNKIQTDFLTWRTPQSAAELRDRYSIKLVAQPAGAGDLLSWDTSWKHGENVTNHVVACNTPVKDAEHTIDHSSLLNPWATLMSSKLPSRIASARKLADYTGNGIFSTSSDINMPRPDFTSLKKVLAAEEQAPAATLPMKDCGKPCVDTVKKTVSTLDFRERGFR